MPVDKLEHLFYTLHHMLAQIYTDHTFIHNLRKGGESIAHSSVRDASICRLAAT